MSFRLVLVVLIACLLLPGCGGGGGGGSTGGGTNPTPSGNTAGVYSVPLLGLPGDQINVGGGGDVFVNADPPSLATGGYYSKIGTCSSSGALTLSGSWRWNGNGYSITGTGAINLQTRSITVNATIISVIGAKATQNDVSCSGSLASDTPPPAPTFVDYTSDPIELPPPIPL